MLIQDKTVEIITEEEFDMNDGTNINYQNDDSSGNDLNGCVDDAERLKTYLTKTCYFNEEDITMLCTHDSTTKNSIQKQLRELVFFFL